jgi:hypothetical protein
MFQSSAPPRSTADDRAQQSHHTPPINEVNRCATLKLDVLTESPPPKVSLGYAVRYPAPLVTEHTLPRLPVFLRLSQPLDFFLDFVSLPLKAILSFLYLAQHSRRFHHFTAVLECLRYTCQLNETPSTQPQIKLSSVYKHTRILNSSPNRSLKNGIKSFSSI